MTNRVLHGTTALLGVILATAGPAVTAVSAAPQWTERCRVPAGEGNLTLSTDWTPRRGIALKFAQKTAGPAAFLSIDNKGGSLLVAEGAAQRNAERVRFITDSLPARPLAAAEMILKFRHDSWSLYVENRLTAVIRPPLEPPFTVFQSDDTMPPNDRRLTRHQKIAEIRFRDDFLSAPEGDNPLAPWEAISGSWSLHAAFQGSWQGRVKKLQPGEVMTDFSPNFYNLGGKGSNAVIVAGHPFYDRYSMQASVQVWPGEMGLVFHFNDLNDYFAFTITKESLQTPGATLKLWHVVPGTESPPPPTTFNGFAQWSEKMGTNMTRRVLAAATTTIVSGQWVMPRVTVSDNRVRCYLDEMLIADVPAALPPGGRFGLFAHSDKNALFDDVSVGSDMDLDLRCPSDFMTHLVHEHGQFFDPKAKFEYFPATSPAKKLSPPTMSTEQVMVVGYTDYMRHVFSARFEPQGDSWAVGLVLGFAGPRRPYRRFVWERRGDREACRLEEVAAAGVTVLEQTDFAHADHGDGPVELAADPTAPGRLGLYRNGRLALVRHGAANETTTGPAGIYVGPDSTTRIVRAAYTTARPNVYRNRFSEKQRFTDDPYMRHWSSPEGEWYEDENRHVWHKSDFFGPFSLFMPVVQNSEIHLGVREGETDGSIIVSVKGPKIVVESLQAQRTADALEGTVPVPKRVTVASGELPASAADGPPPGYTVRCDDYWLWVAPAHLQDDFPIPGPPLLKCRLAKPLEGRRIRIVGFASAALTRSRVIRHRVKDYLFTEAPHDWIINGGHWQIVNRFQCDPRWTHMNGESENNLAALWTKYRFGGDFCVELYAGIRHGWYDRCGDLNMTVMADKTSPGRGYTVTCTGWDFDHSQELTRFYRNGTVIDESDLYLVPRYREGNKRLNTDPLIKRGRDVHGAWYYIKFRRTGNQLEYYFDNQRVFSHRDDSPMHDGRVGLWTFMNSMVVARMKISAEEIEPHPFAVKAVAEPPATAVQQPEPDRTWSVDDPIGCATLSPHRTPEGDRYFVLRNTLGAGNMFAISEAPPVPLSEIAGWTFLVKRTPGAQFNFHYTIGRKDKDGQFVPLQRYFHRLSGSDFSRGPTLMDGGTTIPPVPGDCEDWHTRGDWTSVTVFIPVERFRKHIDSPGLLAKLEGFGNLQPSYVLQGLSGNMPGDAYAVKNLWTVPYDPPPLSVACEWSKTLPNTVILRSTAPYTDRRLATANVTIGRTPVKLTAEPPHRHAAFLPHAPELVRPANGRIPVSVVADGQTFSFELNRSDHVFRDRPMLTGLDGLRAMFENFESGNGSSWIAIDNKSAVLQRNDRAQGNYLKVRNTADRTRLRSTFHLKYPLPQLPILQFRYRATPLVKVSLMLPNESAVRLSENFGSPVRQSSPLQTDWQWRTWHGIITDAMKESALDMRRLAVRDVVIGSCHQWDQTGRYSYWYIDDVVFGPAVSEASPLTFTPRYFAFEGVESVFMTVRPGEKSYHELEVAEAQSLEWRQIANGAAVTQPLRDLQDGVHHLLLRAVDRSGAESSVTDVPFLVDTKPMEVFRFIVKSSSLIVNGSVLNLLFLTDGGAPPILDDLQIRWNDKPVPIDFGALYGTMSSHGHDIRLSLNWSYVFRKQLDRMKDGDEARIFVANIRDGAGNVTPDVSVPVKIDYSADKSPPNIVPPRYRKNVLMASTLQGFNRPPPEIAIKGDQGGEILRDKNGEPYLTCPIHPRVPVQRGMDPPRHIPSVVYSITERTWDLSAHPYVSFRMRIPELPKSGKASISLMIQTATAVERFVIPVFGSATGRGIVALPQKIEWEKNVWNDITIDVFSLLKRSAYEREFRRLRALKLAFVCDNFDRENTFHLQNLYIYAALPNPPAVGLDAYDASGVSGFSWVGPPALEEDVHARAFHLGSWAQIHAHDKAGNKSPPLRAPLSILPRSSVEARLISDDAEDEMD